MARQRYGRAQRRNAGFSGPALIYTLCLGLLLGWYGPIWMDRGVWPPLESPRQSMAADALSAQFGFCHSGGGVNCVVDGDTF
ncbi:hypothetical protein [Sphingobium sp. AEW010]|uniref:hypothetical protein n=1 Tax=unclassified Sphingobium TaxID=2611147 RepID=UPI001A320CA6|nr:hypothetical protein [Sphingobium sp. JAI105]